MKIQRLNCPNCGAKLKIEVKDNRAYCHYCASSFYVDEEKKEFTYNKFVHIKKDININNNTTNTNRYIDDADVIRARTEDREKKFAIWFLAIYFIIGFGGMAIWFISSEVKSCVAESEAEKEGKISAGYYEDYEGENYEAVVEQLEALGFENIKTIDLDDSGLAIWKNETVESVSIKGNKEFDEDDYFKPDVKIIISYH